MTCGARPRGPAPRDLAEAPVSEVGPGVERRKAVRRNGRLEPLPMSADHDHERIAEVEIQPAELADADVIATIYNEGIAGRQATFETEPRTGANFTALIQAERFPLLVAREDGAVVGWAGLSAYSTRQAYAGVAELSIYVAGDAQGRGVGRRLIDALAGEAEKQGFHKIIGKLFPTNTASLRLLERAGFLDVGTHRKHARLDGDWRDVVVLERLLGDAVRRD